MQKVEYFYMYQNEQGGIELKGSLPKMKAPVLLSYAQLLQMQYPVHTLLNFDTVKFYEFYYLTIHGTTDYLGHRVV